MSYIIAHGIYEEYYDDELLLLENIKFHIKNNSCFVVTKDCITGFVPGIKQIIKKGTDNES